MDERAHGLILRTRPLTETSLIVQWLTTDHGRIATVAKGARRPKSAFRGKLDLFYSADLSFQRSRRSDLHNLREVSLRHTYPALRTNLHYLHQAAYCSALIEQTTEPETPLPGFFELLTAFLLHISSQPPQPTNIFAFEIKLLDELGLRPNLSDAAVSPGTRAILEKLLQSDWPTVTRLKLSETQATQIQAFLQGFIVFNVGRIPKGRNLALQETAS